MLIWPISNRKSVEGEASSFWRFGFSQTDASFFPVATTFPPAASFSGPNMSVSAVRFSSAPPSFLRHTQQPLQLFSRLPTPRIGFPSSFSISKHLSPSSKPLVLTAHLPLLLGSRKFWAPAGRNHGELSYGDDFEEDPFLISLVKEAISALKSLFGFVFEQPSQLRYIEWPSFKSTLKTATLTLVLVALLIIALSTLDSVLCYLLAIFLRRVP